jgi:hypothetical protein
MNFSLTCNNILIVSTEYGLSLPINWLIIIAYSFVNFDYTELFASFDPGVNIVDIMISFSILYRSAGTELVLRFLCYTKMYFIKFIKYISSVLGLICAFE